MTIGESPTFNTQQYQHQRSLPCFRSIYISTIGVHNEAERSQPRVLYSICRRHFFGENFIRHKRNKYRRKSLRLVQLSGLMGRFDEFEHAIAAGSQGSFSSVWVLPTQELKKQAIKQFVP
jgi:hypothetical protein